jgi:hypothetical protein
MASPAKMPITTTTNAAATAAQVPVAEQNEKEAKDKVKKLKWRVQYSAFGTGVKERYYKASDTMTIMRWCMMNDTPFFELESTMSYLFQKCCAEEYHMVLDEDHRTDEHHKSLKSLYHQNKKEFVKALTDDEIKRLWGFCHTESEGMQEGNPHHECHSVTIKEYHEPKFVDISL